MTSFAPPNSTAENLRMVNEDMSRILLGFKEYSIVMLDPAGYVLNWNEGAEQLFGFTAFEIIGKHISSFYSQEEIHKGQQWSNLKKVEQVGQYKYEGWKCKKDGTKFYATTVLTVLRHDDHTVRGFAKITHDITIQKKLEEENNALTNNLEEKVKLRTKELETVNKELEAFSYSVSHDLRTPLRAISGYSLILKEDYETKLDAEGRRIIDVIVDNAKMMGKLIDDLLTFSRMARLEVVNEAIDMKRLAEKCISKLLLTEKEAQYPIVIGNIPECKGDENMLKQVWYNLLSNALKYSSKTQYPQIEVGAEDNEKDTVYYVKDNGAGFDMKYADKLFGVFQRLHRHDEFEGTGLGLALAKRIISKHGGEIWTEAALDKGATFYFSIPKRILTA